MLINGAQADGQRPLVWMILNLDRQAMVDNGWTFAWIDARPEFGFERDGLSFSTDPIEYTMEQCQQESQRGLAPCSVEWLYLAIEEELRATDEQVVTVLLGEGPNVEINRELLELLPCWYHGRSRRFPAVDEPSASFRRLDRRCRPLIGIAVDARFNRMDLDNR